MSNVTRLPFTELFERLQSEVIRDVASNPTSEYKYKGVINDTYMTELMLLLPEDYLRTQASIITIADYSTGTVDISAAGTTVDEGDTAMSLTSAISNDFLFKEDDNDLIARVDYTSGTQLTFQDDLTWPHSAVDEGTYRIVLDRYELASDFSHMCEDNVDKPECVYYPYGGGRAYLKPLDNGEYDRKFSFTHGTPGEYTVKWIKGSPYLYINPPDTTTRRIFYNYIPILAPMTEYTTGYLTTLSADPTVVSSGSIWNVTSNIDTDTYTYYFRRDSDGTGAESVWYKVSSITSATELELTANYAGTALTSGTSTDTYTISRISRWPAKFDTIIMYLAALKIDPENKDAARWQGIVNQLIPLHRAVEAKRIHGKRGAYRA